ncbi:hypothetical protein EUTSA_v10029303mg [Eutrema salsugineum]|uniref:Uncharacterized protein n=1 Tax=Eutrema salsugineum TaxID=72664 RepID=V4KJR6_EUTSA|nr:hypothetical protein EUTSA_v10029303mg [Eutrema salsugineum]
MKETDFKGKQPKLNSLFNKSVTDKIFSPFVSEFVFLFKIITHAMKDLQKLSPEIVTINQSFEMEGAEIDKMLIFFYEDLRAIGDSWIMDSDWIYRSKYKNSGVEKNKLDRLAEHVLTALDGLIKMTRERFGMMDLESDGRKSFTGKGVPSEARRSFTRSVSYSESYNSCYPSLLTPRSVLPDDDLNGAKWKITCASRRIFANYILEISKISTERKSWRSEFINGDNIPSMPALPAPPGSGRSLHAKKATSKLRRSAQIANLYWVLKGKLEGHSVQGKTTKANKGQKNVAEKSPVKGARSGMADALAEMTKRSSYFQHIEEDVLARFEGFPEKKLEAIRTAGDLYKKLDRILVELKNWKIEPPLNDLLDKIERYFNKFKGEIETVERTKDEEAKMFQRHNINIDFEVFVQVKETMVDVSSNCMELALKRREANEEVKSREESKMNNMKEERGKPLWRAFQFAIKVYTFAGGHDEQADHLTRQLAHEIQTDPDQTDSAIVS